MPEAHENLNALETNAAAQVLQRCCGSQRWVAQMLAQRPFASTASLLATAKEVFRSLDETDYLEAFAHHPAIGEDPQALAQRFASTAALSRSEQAGVQGASHATLAALRSDNIAYRERFGFIFLVCATGKNASEMLALLRERLNNDRTTEVRVAAAEQEKITALRLAGIGLAGLAS